MGMKRKGNAAPVDPFSWTLAHSMWQGDAPICAIDPGTASTGWWVGNRSGQLTASGECPATEACKQIRTAMGGWRPFALVAMERPVRVAIGNQWKLPWSGGLVWGRLREQVAGDEQLWWPKPNEWRLEAGHATRPAELATADALAMARAAGYPCRTPRGADRTDECMAVCIGLLAVRKMEAAIQAAEERARGTE